MSVLKRGMNVRSIAIIRLVVTIATALGLAIGFIVMAMLVKVSTLSIKLLESIYTMSCL